MHLFTNRHFSTIHLELYSHIIGQQVKNLRVAVILCQKTLFSLQKISWGDAWRMSPTPTVKIMDFKITVAYNEFKIVVNMRDT